MTPISAPHQVPIQAFKVGAASIDVLTAGVADVARALDTGRLTAVQLVHLYLTQIERLNPNLHCVTHTCPNEIVLRQAEECDGKLQQKGGVDRRMEPPCGIPVIVKDNIGTEPDLGMPTTAGSLALLNSTPKEDSHVVKRLRAAGAIILGKANMSELASYRSRTCPDGWSMAGGQMMNVYVGRASPGSSSSGSGVAVAAGMCPLSFGTDTDGSITRPSIQSALYGIRPTVGLISRTGLVPFVPLMDTPGPMAKDVYSLAVGLDVAAGEDSEDEASVDVPRLEKGMRYIDFCVKPSFAGLRIGVPRTNWFDVDPYNKHEAYHPDPALLSAFKHALSLMARDGATVIDPADIPSAVDGSLCDYMENERSIVVKAGFKESMNRYLAHTSENGSIKSIKDLIAYNKTDEALKHSGPCVEQELLEAALLAPDLESAEYRDSEAQARLLSRSRGLDAVLERDGLDAIVLLGPAKHGLSALSGAPLGVIPLGVKEDGEPIGAYFIARRGGEGTLLRIMAAWEQAFGARPLPPIR